MKDNNTPDLGAIHGNIVNAITEITEAEVGFKNMSNKPVELEQNLINALPHLQKDLNDLSNALHNWRINNDKIYKQTIDENGQSPF